MGINTYYSTPTPNYSPEAWAVWGVLLAITGIVLLSSIIYFSYRYRKENRGWTINTLIYMSIYLVWFLLQAFAFAPFLKLPIPFSFDSVWVITVGFIFGPLEGILFGWISDSLRVLINGWSYQFLPSLMYPIIGLISGIGGYIYSNRENMSKYTSIIMFQVIIALLFIISIPAIYFLPQIWDLVSTNGFYHYKGPGLQATQLASIITVVVLLGASEVLFFWFISSDRKREDVILFTILFVCALADRGMELMIRPFMQYFTGYEKIYYVSLLTRLMSSTYLVPTVTIASFAIIKISSMAVKLK